MSGFSQQDNEPLSDINITPFVDVLLVLLIIFMVTAPIINHVISVDLPQDSYSEDALKPMQEPLRVIINKKGNLYIGETLVGGSGLKETQDAFVQRITDWKSQEKAPWFVDVEADVEVQYGTMIPIIARLKELNVSMNLVIQPLPKH